MPNVIENHITNIPWKRIWFVRFSTGRCTTTDAINRQPKHSIKHYNLRVIPWYAHCASHRYMSRCYKRNFLFGPRRVSTHSARIQRVDNGRKMIYIITTKQASKLHSRTIDSWRACVCVCDNDTDEELSMGKTKRTHGPNIRWVYINYQPYGRMITWSL